jgi:DNA-binding YbaB/EbfC family protein
VKDQFKMLRQVQQMQARMEAVQKELDSMVVEATAGGGAVKATASGSQRLLSVSIDPEAMEDREMLPDLIVAAVNEALDRSKELAASKMQEVTTGLGLPPGLV